MELLMTRIQNQTLDCGTQLIVEKMPGVQSAAISWLVPAGHAHDPKNKLGRAAITSEMLLRGSGDRDSRAFADACDALGMGHAVSAGALFMKASTTFIADRLAQILPLFTDIVLKPRFEQGAFEPARDLSLQTLASLLDEPQQRAVLEARSRHYPEPINRSGLGTVEGLGALTLEDIKSGWQEHARPGGSIIAVAGAVDIKQVSDVFNELLCDWSGNAHEPEIAEDAPRGYAHEKDDSNQAQIICVHDAPPAGHEHHMLERVAVSILSGGMSGRLFTEVREKRGLCYAVSASYRSDRDFGSVTGYVGTTPERAPESLDVLLAEFERLRAGAEQDEFDRALVGLKSRVVFSGESTSARAGALASDQHKLGRPRSLDEITDELDAITLDALNAYLSGRTLGRVTIQTLGPDALSPPEL
jgi:predicted Zn-dependent peptidase